MRILLVEDNPADALLFRELLRDSGLDFTLNECLRVSDALAQCQAQAFDIAFLDLNLPDSKGLGGYISLASEYPEVAVIILTGLDDQEVATRAVRMGAQDYLVKGTVEPLSLRRILVYSIERHKAIRALKNESGQDFLTGVFNRRGFEAAAAVMLNGKTTTSILLYVDLDSLKWINDNIGHGAGDEAIKKTADILRHVLRPSDVVARMGGDEFVALLTQADGLHLQDILQRLRIAVAKENEDLERHFNLSFSIGALKQSINAQNLMAGIAAAEKLMHESKSQKAYARFQAPEGGIHASFQSWAGFEQNATM